MRPCAAPRWRAVRWAPIEGDGAPSSASPSRADNTRLRRGDGRIKGGHALAFLEETAMMGSQAYRIGPRQGEGFAMNDARRSDKAQHRLLDLAGGGMRDLVDENDVVGHPPVGNLPAHEL